MITKMYSIPKLTKAEQQRLDAQLRANQKRLEKEKEQKLPPLILPDPNLPVCIIADIDSTLSKRGERGVFDFDKSIDDEPIHQTVFLLRLIDDRNKYDPITKTHIILLTGREEQFSEITNKWLNKHQIPFDKLLMRRTGDRRKADIVKQEIYAGSIRNRFSVFFVLEDHPDNVLMFQKLGLFCFSADTGRYL